MIRTKIIKKMAVSFAVFFFSFNIINVYNVSADTASLTIGGGSIGTGGLETLEGLMPFATPIILSIMHQANMDIKLSQQSQAAGMTKTQYLYDQILNWKEGAPEAVSQVCERILTGTSIDSEGIIYVGQTVLDAIKQFGNWIVSNAGLNFYDSDNVSGGFETVQLGNVNTYYGNVCSFNRLVGTNTYFAEYRSDSNVGWLMATDRGNLLTIAFSKEPITAYQYLNGGQYNPMVNGGLCGQYYMKYNAIVAANISNFVPTLYNLGEMTIEQVQAYLASAPDWQVGGSADIPDDVIEGSSSAWNSFVPSLDLPAGYTGAIDYGILNQILQELEEDKQFEMSVVDYLQAINEAINDQAIDVPIENVDDGTIAYVPDVVVVPDPAYDPVADPDIPDPEEVTPVIDESEPASFDDLMEQPLTLDLKNFFPFCIPFDLYNLFQKFNAPAVAPYFRINFTVPIVNVEVDYTIDFSPFNDVAAVLRTMELIAMVVLLAIATRRIFLRG